MSPARTVWLVMGREIGDRLRNKLYVLATLALAVAVAGLIILPGLFGDDAPQRFDLGVVGPVPAGFEDAVAANAPLLDAEVELTELADREAAAVAVGAGDVDAVLLGESAFMVDGPADPTLRAAAESALHQVRAAADLEAAGLDQEQLAGALAPPQPLPVVNTAGEEGVDEFFGPLLAFAATILLFVAVTVNASSLLTGAVEEKSSRVVEVLLGSVRPWQLLTAKIVALTALALAQLGLVVAAALGANAFAGTLELPPATAATVAASVVMLVIGFVFYAALYTVAGSLASTAEDAQASAGPLGFVVMGAYFAVVFAVLPSPVGTWAQVLTYLPPTAPFTVPARVALEAIPFWQVAVAVGVTLLAVVVTIGLAARLYAASLLAGDKLTWREAWRSEPIR